jgi:hypothetical protein
LDQYHGVRANSSHLTTHDGEPTFEEKVGCKFLNLVAKLAPSTIFSILPYQAYISAIQTLSWMINQEDFAFGGTHGLQTKEGV